MILPIPEVDLVFAISAAADSDRNFQQMKSVVNSIISTYTMEWIRYGVIMFGSDAIVRVNMKAFFPTDGVLKNLIAGLSKPSGTPALDTVWIALIAQFYNYAAGR